MSASLINDRFLLQISVAGYEFPDVDNDVDDANWREVVEQDYCGFSEPDIAFEVIRNEEQAAVGLSVHLMDEFQPPTKVLVPRENNVVTLRFHTPPDVLQNFAEELMNELQAFPMRGVRPERT
jgi:hypothetical protein